MADEEQWTDPSRYETVSDGPPVLPVLMGTVCICLGVLTILLLVWRL